MGSLYLMRKTILNLIKIKIHGVPTIITVSGSFFLINGIILFAYYSIDPQSQSLGF